MNQFKKKAYTPNCHAQGLESYRAVEHALAIHGNVEATLDSLDGHHSQTHRNKIKQGCIGAGWGRGDRENRRQIEDRMGQSSFRLTLVDTAAVWSLLLGCLSAVRWAAQDARNTDACQCDGPSIRDLRLWGVRYQNLNLEQHHKSQESDKRS